MITLGIASKFDLQTSLPTSLLSSAPSSWLAIIFVNYAEPSLRFSASQPMPAEIECAAAMDSRIITGPLERYYPDLKLDSH